MRNIKILILFSIFYFLFSAFSAFAFESTSTSFEVHAGDLESVTGSSTSASFSVHNAAGQTATGTSTSSSFEDFSGILYWMRSSYIPQYEQIHLRWRNDDGGEATSTWAQVEDGTYTSFPKTTTKRVRFEVSNSGWTRGAAPTFQLQYATTTNCTSGSYTAIPTDTSFAWQIVASANFADGATTTNQLTAANNTFVAGQMKDTGNTTSAITLASNNFTEIEYALQATSNAVSSTTYCFRLFNSNPLYTRYAKAVIAGYAASGNVVSSTYDTGTLYGAAYNSILWQGTQPLNTLVRFQLATSNCANGGNDYPACTGTWGSGANGSDYVGGATCASNDYYTPTPNTPVMIGCTTAAYNHKNKRYFRYKVQLCSSIDCVTQGDSTPKIDGNFPNQGIVINWSP